MRVPYLMNASAFTTAILNWKSLSIGADEVENDDTIIPQLGSPYFCFSACSSGRWQRLGEGASNVIK